MDTTHIRKISTSDMERLRTCLPRSEGAEAIYRENGMVAHVSVDGIICDDNGVHAKATLLQPAVTFYSRACTLVAHTDHWEFGGAYEYLFVSSWLWSFTYYGPTLYFDDGLIGELSELGFRPIENCSEGRFSLSQYDQFQKYTDRVEAFRRRKMTKTAPEAKEKKSLWSWWRAGPSGKSPSDLLPEL
jgi:hypothetical protein